MSYTPLGEITVKASDTRVVVGSFSIEEGDDTIWIDVQQTSPVGPWPWSYGILSWQTDFGLELGSVKAYTANAGEVYRLGVGRTPRSRSGSIVYEPRSFNLAWVKKGYSLSLSFAATSGQGPGGGGIGGGGKSVAFPVVDGAWRYAASSGLLQLEL